jgi:hypothetical protein
MIFMELRIRLDSHKASHLGGQLGRVSRDPCPVSPVSISVGSTMTSPELQDS